MLSTLDLFGFALVFMVLLMTVTWWLARRWDNYSIVDAVWGGSFALVTLLFVIAGSGWLNRRLVLLAIVALWSLRLGLFLGKRIKSHHPQEDERYKSLRAEYGSSVASRFFLFFQYQALSVVLLSIPFLLIAMNERPEFEIIEIFGFVVSLLALIGEGIADSQANRFKSDPGNRQKTCDVGLWKYSRHPNYFFESCVWWGFFLVSLGAEHGIYMIYAPLIILFLLLKVTGVPPSEAQALKKRGDVYRAYQAKTSVFVPWFPKKN